MSPHYCWTIYTVPSKYIDRILMKIKLFKGIFSH